MNIYFDNAATTALDKEVLAEMLPYLTDNYGNPSSIHALGRKAKAAIEKSRKIVANYLRASTAEIFFTSGGTESNNMVIKQAVHSLGVQQIIISPIEHHGVLHAAESEARKGIQVNFVRVNSLGEVDLIHLEELLSYSKEKKTLVSIMHANNEIGTIQNIQKIGELCLKNQAFFHSDSVQTIGHYSIDVTQIPVHFLSGSAHKLHGPKGTGFVYINSDVMLQPMIDGGAQERNMRAGTENVAGIVGFGKALEGWIKNREEYQAHIEELRQYMKKQLEERLGDVQFNGFTDERSLYHVLSVSLPANAKTDLLLFNLDIDGICASGGSACASGSMQASHVLEAIKADENRRSVRFSFSKYNTKEEVDYAVEKLQTLIN